MWRATFQDNSILSERNADGKEVLFAKVMEKVDELKSCLLYTSPSPRDS